MAYQSRRFTNTPRGWTPILDHLATREQGAVGLVTPTHPLCQYPRILPGPSDAWDEERSLYVPRLRCQLRWGGGTSR